MERRSLLKALTALPFVTHTVGGKNVQAVAIEQGREYVIFVDSEAINIDALANIQINPDHPLAGAPIVPVCVQQGQSVQDAVAIYGIESLAKSHESPRKLP